MNSLSGFGQQFSKPTNDIPQTNGFLNGVNDHFHQNGGVPDEADSAADLIDGLPGMLSSLEVNDFDSNKKHSLPTLGGGNSIWSDIVLFSPIFNSNGSNNVSYGWGPPGSKVTSPQPYQQLSKT